MGVSRLLDTFQVAAILGVDPKTVRTMQHKGLLHPVGTAPRQTRFGRPRNLYARDEVLALKETRRIAA